MRSRKLVSMRLNAVVCELAMLPEMFSSAYDSARRPPTAVVRAPKIPMTYSPNSIRAARRSRETEAASGEHVASVVPNYKIYKNQILKKKAPVRGPGHICRAGNNCRALTIHEADG